MPPANKRSKAASARENAKKAKKTKKDVPEPPIDELARAPLIPAALARPRACPCALRGDTPRTTRARLARAQADRSGMAEAAGRACPETRSQEARRSERQACTRAPWLAMP